MAIEVEQKFRVADIDRLEQQLAELAATAGEHQVQVDRYYAHPQRDFATTDEALRLRRIGTHNYITYKGPKLDPTTKTRRELELVLPEGDAGGAGAAELLDALSFRPVLEVKKLRRHFSVRWQDAEIGVAIDHLNELGDFVELEIVTDASKMQAALAKIAALAERLQLSDSERRSYLELLLAARNGR
jgi:adenylate cyclase class 2